MGAHQNHQNPIGANWRNHFSCNSDFILMMILAQYWRIKLAPPHVGLFPEETVHPGWQSWPTARTKDCLDCLA
jgi:hypothetical protein